MISENQSNEPSTRPPTDTEHEDEYSNNLINEVKTKAAIDPNIVGQPIWYIILSIYAFLLTSTGFVTFFQNNNFSSRNEHIEQLNQIETSEELQIYEEMILAEVQNIKEVNNIANQAFNVVLGSLLGFLSGTLTTLDADEELDSSRSINIQKE
ncbi:hypothetical protein PN466_21055 [Roseofilum reptotaenium CS-1145]|uniref:Uncharacterized protein n=1 Tax=Roseofilum reptotaenium AO1-A TaxID=1925591 RepID=A0A1L9QLN4_9CYAN|nr:MULTISPECIES: hypothetical protein [Roseofilum]MBP0029564.1 hypothetical protein [Roseofilum sp. Guam]MDB9519436.1 hypothetical protein [Roseofilum reptotaenium CS-1145]OJJ19794.1 hypothetical protein BI308_21020 [Roseofilum reptotaenium AO1-A]